MAARITICAPSGWGRSAGCRFRPTRAAPILEALGFADRAAQRGAARRAAILARRHRRRGRSRRGDPADQGVRPDPDGAACPRRGIAAAGIGAGATALGAGAPHPGRARPRRDRSLLVHRRARGRAVRRRQARIAARQPDQRRSRRDAAIAAAGACRRRPPQRRSRLCRCRAVRDRSRLRRRPPAGQRLVAAGLRAGHVGP